MAELDLHLGCLEIGLTLLERQVEEGGRPYTDWLSCEVNVAVPAFSGRFRWNVMPSELRALADNLDRLYERLPQQGTVSFAPLEPNTTLSFAMDPTGHVSGEFAFQPDFVEGAILRGTFAIDQSYLPGLVRQIRAFVAEAVNAA